MCPLGLGDNNSRCEHSCRSDPHHCPIAEAVFSLALRVSSSRPPTEWKLIGAK